MKKIMFVIGGLANGGAERVVASVASALSNKNFSVSILNYYSSDIDYSFSNEVNRINISNGNINDYNRMSIVTKIRKIRENIIKEKPDEIICFLSHPSVFVYLATLFTKYNKRISFAIRANPNMEKGKIASLQKKFIKYVKRIITQNEGQTTCFSSKLKHKIVVIPNPMYDELFENQKTYASEPMKIVSVGRLSNQKNYHLSINAFEVISKKYPNIEYYIYGSGKLENELKDLIKNKELEEKVHIKGFEKDRNKIYGDKDIFLMTSKFEGMPNALAEAMCMGIPSISTDCDFGPRDLILNENMGILLKDYEVETLVDALENMIKSYKKYVDLGKNARNVLRETYSFEKIINMWVDLLK